MNSQQAHKQAVKQSKTEGAQCVVYIFDEGYSVFDVKQAEMYAALVLVEALYVDGVCVATAADAGVMSLPVACVE